MNKLISYNFLLLLLFSCTVEEEPTTLFTLLDSDKTNVDFSNNLTDTEEFNIVEYLNYYNGAGIAAGDINNDGLVDLYFASNQEENKLYLNEGDLEFKDITDKANVTCPGDWKTGVSMADVNGDGYLDIYVCQVGDYKTVRGQNYLYINNGDLTFSDQTVAYGLQYNGFSTQSLFIDYDNDGDLDMFLLNHAIHTKKSYGRAAIIRYTRDMKTGDRLFEQIEKEGKPYFVNVTEKAGIFSSRIGYGLGIASGDVNNDGCIDIYVSNDFHENDYLYLNNCDGTFTEKIRTSVSHTSKSSMGNDMADFNNDGLLDIISLDMLPEDETILKNSAGEEMYQVHDMKEKLGYYYQLTRNCLQLNQGNALFSEIGGYAGVYATDWSWAPLFFDADNDGRKDLFITNGIPNRPNDLDYLQFIEDNARALNSTGVDRISNAELIEIMPSDTIANYAYKNNNDLTFTNKAPSWGMKQKSFSNGSVYADLDNDGDLDYVVSNLFENCFIYRNNSERLNGNNYLKIKLNGSDKNRFGIGAKVEIKINGIMQVQQLVPVHGSMSSMDPILNFGTGEETVIDTLQVDWPGGKQEIMTNIAANQMIQLSIHNAEMPSHKQQHALNTIFVDFTDSISSEFMHQESDFSDFDNQPLLPYKLSTQGPKMAIGDITGDGLQDIYICGGANQSGQLMTQQTNFDFVIHEQKLFDAQSEGEEVDAVFFDADGDNDLDLYVARGSTEHSNSPDLLKDLFYINDGKGNFKLDKKRIPIKQYITSCIRPCDFDDDGDIDLFIGSSPNLNQYGIFTNNQLLKNNGKGYFSDISNSIGSTILNIGMVSDAVWSDIDGDEIKDLIVVGRWMNVSVFKNNIDSFINITAQSGLSESTGWWNTIVANDIDDDGDIDFIAGNVGLNTKASIISPSTLYLKDFDGNGKTDPIICFEKNKQNIPFATRDDLIAQIPSLKSKFTTYSDYAKVRSIEEIFETNQLSDAITIKTNVFQSCIIENLGNEKFALHPLPKEAQLFPIFAINIQDFDNDEIKDILIGGNISRTNISYGRYDTGYGLLLKGTGSLNFQPIAMNDSGINIRGDLRDIKTLKNNLTFIARSDDSWKVLKLR